MSKKVVTDSPKDKSLVSLSHQSKKQRIETPLQKKNLKKNQWLPGNSIEFIVGQNQLQAVATTSCSSRGWECCTLNLLAAGLHSGKQPAPKQL